MHLRPASQKDMAFLLELRRQTMHPHQVASGLISSPEVDKERVLARFDCPQIILLGEEPVGLLKVIRDSKDWDLKQIQVTPSLQGRGIGTQLIQSIITEARRSGASLRLKVLRANPARRLYERLGLPL